MKRTRLLTELTNIPETYENMREPRSFQWRSCSHEERLSACISSNEGDKGYAPAGWDEAVGAILRTRSHTSAVDIAERINGVAITIGVVVVQFESVIVGAGGSTITRAFIALPPY
jgi:hypothetical protein